MWVGNLVSDIKEGTQAEGEKRVMRIFGPT
jgi:hypothetical protein